MGIWNLNNEQELSEEKPSSLTSSRKRTSKTPLLDLNLDDHINNDSEPSTSSGPKRSRLNINSALTEVEKDADCRYVHVFKPVHLTFAQNLSFFAFC